MSEKINLDHENLQATLVITTLNELENLKWFMPRLKKEWYDELIIIDGGSTDGTVEFCKENGYPIFRQPDQGLPDAFEEAYRLSTKEILIFLSPDGNSIPELIPVLTEKMREGNDVVVASRYLGSAKSYDDDFMTALGNKMFTTLINLLFGRKYTDSLIMFRAYRREAIEKMHLHTQRQETWLRRKFSLLNSWELGSLIRGAKLNLKIAEIPGDEPKRVHGVRKLSITTHGTAALLQVLDEFFRGRRFLKHKERKI